MFHGLASMFSKNEKTLSHCLMKAPSRDCINGYLGMKQPKQEAQSITSQAVRKKSCTDFYSQENTTCSCTSCEPSQHSGLFL